MTNKSSRDRPLRFVSAASLFDGHDAAINMIRRLLQAHGAEVVHLGHNRSVADIVRAAIQEDADAIAVSSYQGGHNEYFRYMVDMLREQGVAHIRVVVGGGGTISPDEIAAGIEAASAVFASHGADPLACAAANAKLENDEELTREEARLCVIWQMADDKAFRAITLGWLKRDIDIWLTAGEAS